MHISSKDPAVLPKIDPKFGLLDIDVKVQIAISRLIREFWASEPIRGLVGVETTPGFDVVPTNASDELWEDWLAYSCK